MNNNKRLETILKIRETRDSIENLNISNEEKEILKQSLNLYEEELDIDIAKMNNVTRELNEENITYGDNIVNVPIEENTLKYKEYANVQELDIINITNNLLSKLENYSQLNNSQKVIMLISLKKYLLSLEHLKLVRKNNEEILKNL